jgi:hypothetical protein
VPRSNAPASCVPAIGSFDTTSVPNGPLTITCSQTRRRSGGRKAVAPFTRDRACDE